MVLRRPEEGQLLKYHWLAPFQLQTHDFCCWESQRQLLAVPGREEDAPWPLIFSIVAENIAAVCEQHGQGALRGAAAAAKPPAAHPNVPVSLQLALSHHVPALPGCPKPDLLREVPPGPHPAPRSPFPFSEEPSRSHGTAGEAGIAVIGRAF